METQFFVSFFDPSKRRYMMKMITTSKHFCVAFFSISAAFLARWIILFYSNRDTQLILHPFDSTKSVIKDATYVVIFDGGSTGTRLHVFSFFINQNFKQRKIVLEKESFFYTKPGLSSYFYNVTEASNSLDPLIRKAFNTVPFLWAPLTPIVLKATAGLRLLSEETAINILESVERKFKLLPYKVYENSVSMLDELDEGLYAWYTVNFLLEKLHQINNSIATLDLGGGSTQVTFSTSCIRTLVKSPQGYIVKRNIEGELEYIYTHSYLGNGLMAARKSILLENVTVSNSIEPQTLKFPSNIDVFNIKSPCFKTTGNQTKFWEYNNERFHITHDQTFGDSWTKCLKNVRQFVANSHIHKPEELETRQIYAMGYFYDRMKDVRVIKKESGSVKLRDYFLYAENVCSGSIKVKKQSFFLCLDLVYIASYLHYGLGLPLNKDITLVKKINGFETSWALGAAINMLNSW